MLPSRRFVPFLLALLPACADPANGPADDDMSPAGGKADDVEPADFACQNVNIAGGLTALAEHHDPIAELLLKRGDTCPTNYAEMVEKLRTVDPDGCVDGQDLRTRIVSDDARLVDNASNYRTFTTRACGSHDESALAWTLLSVRENEDIGARTFIEMMAFDPQTELFNFYTLSGGWNFEGSTLEVLDGSIGCASCHNGGGLIFKELDEPWIHWESDGAMLPGADELFDAHAPMFGVRGDGEELERVVRQGNEAIIDGRIAHHSTPAVGSVRELLRPLFCQIEMNLDTAGEKPGAPIDQIPADFFVDPHFGVERGVPMDDGVYEQAITDAGQRVRGVSPEPRDTAFKFVFPERAGIDNRYVERLLELGVIDQDFATDVMAIDFTNPLYSEARCDLLDLSPTYGDPEPTTPGDDDDDDAGTDGGTGDPELVDPGDCCSENDGTGCSNPEIQACVCAVDSFCCDSTWDSVCVGQVESASCFDCNGDGELGGGGGNTTPPPTSSIKIKEATPDAIRQAFIDALTENKPEEGTPAAQLLAHLENRDDETEHRARVDAFFAACAARDQAELMADVLRVANGLRSETAGKSIIEHSEQMPETNLDSSLVSLEPGTCALPDGG